MAYTVNTPVETTPTTQAVKAVRRGTGPLSTPEQDLEVARVIARLMDASFTVGGVKVGLDSLVGLVPVAGDAITLAIGLYPVFLARKHKLGKVVIARMLGNLGIDFLTGVVPLAGDVFDVFFKANLKNVKLLEEAMAKRGVR